MPNKMLIDATHPEETRVVVVRGNRVEEFDFELAHRKQPLRGNIYLAKVTRVEPSLQAAFVEYGGNRHGFLAFSEIHPDYYQIPVADRQALIEDEERAQREEEAELENRGNRRRSRHRNSRRRDGGERVRSAVIDENTPQPDLDTPEAEFATSDQIARCRWWRTICRRLPSTAVMTAPMNNRRRFCLKASAWLPTITTIQQRMVITTTRMRRTPIQPARPIAGKIARVKRRTTPRSLA